MVKKIGIVGIGHAKFGKRLDSTIRELAFEAVMPCLEFAGITQKEIDATVVGVAGEEFAQQGSPAAAISDYVGMSPKPTLRVEAACTTGSMAIRAAYGLISSGIHELVLVIGVEKMNNVSSARATELMARAGDTKWEYPFGVSFPGFYALFATRHMFEFGTTREQLAMVGVKNHHYGNLNEYAHLRKEITLEEAVNAVQIAYPLGLYDCSLISDGAAAVILASEERCREFEDVVYITGIGAGSESMLVSERESLVGLPSATRAARQAYKMAGCSEKDIDVADVHDCFTIAEIMAYEDLGFCKKGEGGKFVEEEQSYIGGKTPVNVDGGLKSKGHPIAATGVSMAVEITKQLLGEASKRQVEGAEIGLSHNVGQSGQYVNVHIYQR
ncbi:MAG: thiolase domain-containing protein [Candidatus Methanofastidiosia archaeon]